MNEAAKIIDRINKISSLPVIFDKVNEHINDPNCSATEIGNLIEKDQALTFELLRLANSAFYGFPRRIETITKAIAIIGFKQLRDLVLTISVKNVFSQFGENSSLNVKSFWEHSMACGIACRNLSIYKGDTNSENHFVAGFLHDIGRLVLLEHFPEKWLEVYNIAKKESRLADDVEREVIGFTHADVGGELIKAWNLSESLSEAVTYHHNPSKSIQHSQLTAIVHVADIIVHACQFGFSGNFFLPPLAREAWELIALKENILPSVINKIDKQVAKAQEFMQ